MQNRRFSLLIDNLISANAESAMDFNKRRLAWTRECEEAAGAGDECELASAR
jgi:hypothetical protein